MAGGHGGARKGAGRKKDECEVRAVAKEYTVEAMERLAFWMRSDNAKASVSACLALLNRAHGMPTQQVDLNVNDSLSADLEYARRLATEGQSAVRH